MNEYTGSLDVIICGGGLAGQTLARQLKLKMPSLAIAIVEKNTFPLPVAACKVGESTVEIAAFYFSETLELKDYFKNAHFAKMGLRYFFGNSQECISRRPELGLARFPMIDSYQIDRGIYENDLCAMNKATGVSIFEETSVQEICINDADALHEVTCKAINLKSTFVLKGRWVIDAMGRRNFLQRKFGLKYDLKENCSAAWFRVEGRFDYGDTVPSTETQWHGRVPNGVRYFSTSHMMGNGYWVWTIPLSSGNTSVGIVTSESLHPCASYNSIERAMKWLEINEPRIFEHLQKFKLIDFKSIKNYAYTSKEIFSQNRWACIGEAGLFSDPFYSPGSNVIGFGNSCVTKMIELDVNHCLTKETVDHFNNFIILYNDSLIKNIHSAYPYFGNQQVMLLNYLWDTTLGWAIIIPQMYNSLYLDLESSLEVAKITSKLYLTGHRLKELFLDWHGKAKNTFTFEFVDYLSIPFVREIYDRNLQKGKAIQDVISDYRMNVQILDRFAKSIFTLAVGDTMPEELIRLENGAIDTTKISLHSEKWDQDMLFSMRPPDHDYHVILGQLKNCLKFT